MGQYVFRPPPTPQRARPSAILPAQVFDNPPIRRPSVAALSMVVALWQTPWGPHPQMARPVTVPIASVEQIDTPPPRSAFPWHIWERWVAPAAVSLRSAAVPVEPQGDQPPPYVPFPYQIRRAWQPPWGPWPGPLHGARGYPKAAPPEASADPPPPSGPGTGASDANVLAAIRMAWPERGEPRLSQPQVGKRNLATLPLVFGEPPPVRGSGYYRWNVFIAWQPVWGPRPNQHGWLASQTPPSQVGVVGDPPRSDMNLVSLMWGGFR